jgi:hypothetical protein
MGPTTGSKMAEFHKANQLAKPLREAPAEDVPRAHLEPHRIYLQVTQRQVEQIQSRRPRGRATAQHHVDRCAHPEFSAYGPQRTSTKRDGKSSAPQEGRRAVRALRLTANKDGRQSDSPRRNPIDTCRRHMQQITLVQSGYFCLITSATPRASRCFAKESTRLTNRAFPLSTFAAPGLPITPFAV